MKTKNWTSCSKQVNEKPQKSFYGVYFIVKWNSLWKNGGLVYGKNGVCTSDLIPLCGVNEQEETARLTFF